MTTNIDDIFGQIFNKSDKQIENEWLNLWPSYKFNDICNIINENGKEVIPLISNYKLDYLSNLHNNVNHKKDLLEILKQIETYNDFQYTYLILDRSKNNLYITDGKDILGYIHDNDDSNIEILYKFYKVMKEFSMVKHDKLSIWKLDDNRNKYNIDFIFNTETEISPMKILNDITNNWDDLVNGIMDIKDIDDFEFIENIGKYNFTNTKTLTMNFLSVYLRLGWQTHDFTNNPYLIWNKTTNTFNFIKWDTRKPNELILLGYPWYKIDLYFTECLLNHMLKIGNYIKTENLILWKLSKDTKDYHIIELENYYFCKDLTYLS